MNYFKYINYSNKNIFLFLLIVLQVLLQSIKQESDNNVVLLNLQLFLLFLLAMVNLSFLYTLKKELFFLQPIVLNTLFFLFLSVIFPLVRIINFTGDNFDSQVYFEELIHTSMYNIYLMRTLGYTFWGMLSLFLGYYVFFPKYNDKKDISAQKAFVNDIYVKDVYILFLLMISIIGRFWAMKMGIFGFSDFEIQAKYGHLLMYVSYISLLGTFCLFLSTVNYIFLKKKKYFISF
jgi:hypothetical protein